MASLKDQLIALSDDVHRISRQLHPAILDDLGLEDALRSECDRFAEREGVVTHFHCGGLPDRLPKDITLCLYRIAQEALRNVAKHAQTDRVELVLNADAEFLDLEIRDFGRGFFPAEVRCQPGLGLASMEERTIYAARALRSGASGFVLKHSASSELVTAIRESLVGRTYVTPAIAEAMERLMASRSNAADEGLLLTHRQREVLQLFAEGRSAKEVASVLHISVRTAESHKARIMSLLGATTTSDLVLCAIRHGLIAPT